MPGRTQGALIAAMDDMAEGLKSVWGKRGQEGVAKRERRSRLWRGKAA